MEFSFAQKHRTSVQSTQKCISAIYTETFLTNLYLYVLKSVQLYMFECMCALGERGESKGGGEGGGFVQP